MSRSNRKMRRFNSTKGVKIPSEVQAEGRELLDASEAASCYGCQVDRIGDFIARDMLHPTYLMFIAYGMLLLFPLFDKQEVEELRQKHLYKQINGKSKRQRK